MDNKFIEEDFERDFLKDQMYILEKKKEEEEWQRMEEERLPAKINVSLKTKRHVKRRKRREIKGGDEGSKSIPSKRGS